MRSLLRLVRPQFPETYRKENSHFRDAAAALSDLRDTGAVIECYDALIAHFENEVQRGELGPIRAALTRERKKAEASVEDPAVPLAEFRGAMLEARSRVEGWQLAEKGFAALAPGLTMAYRRGRNAMRKACAEPTVDAFHEWRKRSKDLRYHSHLLQNTWKPVLRAWRQQVRDLSDYLGDDHDLAVLRAVLEGGVAGPPDSRRVQVLLGLIDRRSLQLRAHARALGQRIYAEKPKAFRARMARYWKVARTERSA
jgi:CHAD domain-containing protein